MKRLQRELLIGVWVDFGQILAPKLVAGVLGSMVLNLEQLHVESDLYEPGDTVGASVPEGKSTRITRMGAADDAFDAHHHRVSNYFCVL